MDSSTSFVPHCAQNDNPQQWFLISSGFFVPFVFFVANSKSKIASKIAALCGFSGRIGAACVIFKRDDMAVSPPNSASQTRDSASANPPFWRRTPLVLAALLGASLLLLLWQLGAYGLIDVDEGRYAEVPREMFISGDWLTPRLNYINFFDKPPLLYWGIALSYAAFGVSEWAARFVPALSALVGIVAAYGLGRRMFGPRAGWSSGLILLTCLMWTVMARVVLTDMVVSSLVFCALALWWLAISDDSPKRRTGYLALFWVSLGLGTLAKGPVAPVLCGGALFFYLLICKRWSDLKKMGWIWGLPLFIAVAAPWYSAIAARHPEFNNAFWFEQNFARFTGAAGKVDHVEGPLFLFQYLPLVVFPWSVFALPALFALFAGWKTLWPARTQKQRAAMFLLGAFAFVMLFFSASESKLITYILPVVPPFAILLAAYFDRLLNAPKLPTFAGICGGIFAAVLIIGGVVAWFVAPAKLDPLGANDLVARGAALALLAWGLALAFAVYKRSAGGLIGATAGGYALCFMVGITLVAEIAPGITTAPLVAQIKAGLGPETEILAIGFSQSLPFYTGKRMRVMGTPDELRHAKAYLPKAERERWFFQIAPDLRRLMLTDTPTYCVIRRNKFLGYEQRAALALLDAPGQIFEVASNDRFVIIANLAASRLTQPVPNSKFAQTLNEVAALDTRGRQTLLDKGKTD